ncbi:MAG: cache domain-containing protein [Deltaproteobacteria bacterium]|nr:cache domain-containing protein [Deltaproteobacteria bacterium]
MKINTQIIVAVSMSMALLFVFTIMLSGYSMNNLKDDEIVQMRETLISERKSQLRDMIKNAHSVLETANFYEPAQAAISNMRFGEKGQNYFFVIDRSGMFWVNPAQPEMVGKVHLELKDMAGVEYIRGIIQIANVDGEGFINYQDKKQGSTESSTKLVHFKCFDKWNWIVCAGIFLDDIETILNRNQQQIQSSIIDQIKTYIFGGLLASILTTFATTFYFRKKLVQPIRKLTESVEEMVAGNFDKDIEVFKSSQEINKLVDAMQRMQASFIIAYNRLKDTIKMSSVRQSQKAEQIRQLRRHAVGE